MNKEMILSGIVGFLLGVVITLLSIPAWGGMMGYWHSGTRVGNYMMGGGGMMERAIDEHFIEQMIPHHEGAIAMAELALRTSKRPEILSLSKGIIEAQTLEITMMNEWYTTWFGKAPRESGHGMMMGGHGMMGMEGDIDELTRAPDFDKEFISQMIVHHEMAVMMARMLQNGTDRTEMKTLADQIITSQTREIEMMRSWYKDWYGGQ